MSTAVGRRGSDARLAALLALQGSLLEATRAWAHGARPGPEVAGARHKALRLNHQRYVDLVPAYRAFAEREGALGPASLEAIVNGLTLHELFKSYDPAWLARGDFEALTGWLEGVCTRVAGIETGGIGDIGTWRERLRDKQLFLSFSSGTSGRMSFVPRDLITWKALVGNGSSYTDQSWRAGPDGALLEFDCLVLGPRGGGMGILDAGAGLARTSRRSHFLFDRVLTADAVRELRRAGTDVAREPGAGWDVPDPEDAYAKAFDFVRGSGAERRRMLIFAAPFQARRFCERIVASCDRLATPEGSLLVTGGGWKSFRGEQLSRRELLRLVEATLGIDPSRCIDAYSTSELNCTLSTCREGRYHVPPLLEAVVLDQALTGEVGRPGFGTLGFLDPFAASYPGFVISGDQALLSEGSCGCGRWGTFIEGEIQRAEGLEVRGCGGVLESITV